MHENVVVDERMLDLGFYATSKPVIHYEHESVESMVFMINRMKDMSGNIFASDEYIKNLKKCRLVDVLIEIKP